MSASPPFIDHSSGTLDTDKIITESIPLTKLIGLVGVVALIPFAIASTFRIFEGLFMLFTQFMLAVGSGIVLLYIITRAIQLAEV
jgi:hypothetical protein